MGKTTKYDPDEEPTQRDRKRDRDGWKVERQASRKRKNMRKGEFTGMRNERAREGV